MKRAIIALLLIAAIGAGVGAYYIRRGGVEIQVNTSPVTRGDIVDVVGATGTLQPVRTVQVGSQVSGTIQWLGADFNSIVRQGQVIARIDPSLLQAQVEQARANLVRAKADLIRYQADIERTKVALIDAQQKFGRAKELTERNLQPQSDLDTAKTAVDTVQAQLQSSQASLQSGQAQMVQAEAALNQTQVNLDHAVIAAPIDGIVIQRSVDVGQTVAASLQSPTLFAIAADLTQMQATANIDEADVGRIRPGQRATFRVDAYPGEEFEGTVAQIRLQPVVVQNVTTYGTVINVPNQALKLKPGMTANVRVEIARRTDVIRVPNTALRFRPTADVFAAFNQAVPPEAQSGGRGGMMGRGGGGGAVAPSAGSSQSGGAAAPTGGNAPAAGGVAPGAAMPSGTRGGGAMSSAQQAPAPGSAGDARAGDGTMGGGRRGQGGDAMGGAAMGGDQADRRAQMLERFKTMPPAERQQMLERMTARGMDVSGLEGTTPTAPAPKDTTGALTIDALFAPLPPTESTGRAWLFINKELKPVRLRLGISDGTNTELLSGELEAAVELVTGVTGMAAGRPNVTGVGNPMMRGRGGPMGGGGGIH